MDKKHEEGAAEELSEENEEAAAEKKSEEVGSSILYEYLNVSEEGSARARLVFVSEHAPRKFRLDERFLSKWSQWQQNSTGRSLSLCYELLQSFFSLVTRPLLLWESFCYYHFYKTAHVTHIRDARRLQREFLSGPKRKTYFDFLETYGFVLLPHAFEDFGAEEWQRCHVPPEQIAEMCNSEDFAEKRHQETPILRYKEALEKLVRETLFSEPVFFGETLPEIFEQDEVSSAGSMDAKEVLVKNSKEEECRLAEQESEKNPSSGDTNGNSEIEFRVKKFSAPCGGLRRGGFGGSRFVTMVHSDFQTLDIKGYYDGSVTEYHGDIAVELKEFEKACCEAQHENSSSPSSSAGEAINSSLRALRYLRMNVWRPVAPMNRPVVDNAMCFCDPKSVLEKDICWQETVVAQPASSPPSKQEEKKTNILGLKYDRSQKWFHYPKMTKNEVVLFKQVEVFSEQKRGEKRGGLRRSIDRASIPTFHTAFQNLGLPESARAAAETRCSFEYRFSLVLEEPS